MKFQAKHVGLMEGLTPAVTAATTGVKKDYEFINNLMMTASASGVVVQANNGYVALTNKIEKQSNLDYKPLDAGTATVKATDLNNILGGFASDENIEFEVRGNELIVTAVDDPERFYTVPLAPKPLEMPVDPQSFNQEAVIDRELLLRGLSKVIWAIGWEKYRQEFLYWIMRLDANKVRFACGDGGRFAVYEEENDEVEMAKLSEKMDICLFKEQTKDLMPKLLPMMSGGEVSFKIYNSDQEQDEDGVNDQTVIECGDMKLVLVGHDPGVKWPNEDKFLTRTAPYRMVTNLSDWTLAIKGMQATYNEDIKRQHVTHLTTLEFDFSKKVIHVKNEGPLRGNGKIKIKAASPECSGKPDWGFTCTSQFLGEVFKHGDPNDNVQLEFADPTKVAVVRFHADPEKINDAKDLYNTNNSTKTVSRYTIFFGPKAKK
jgi:hypothetical protein